MSGHVFTEFVQWVADKLSPEMADAVRTAVVNDPHVEWLPMAGVLSRHAGLHAGDLVKAPGGHLP